MGFLWLEDEFEEILGAKVESFGLIVDFGEEFLE